MSNSHLFLKSCFPRAPLGLGIGRYVCQLQRVTLKFCKNRGASHGVREFLENDLIDYARENPGVVVYVKPRRHRVPVIKAEYLSGEVQWIPVTNYTRADIAKWMQLLCTQFHDGPAMRYRKLWHTEFPSIQGPWTPFTFKDPKYNTTEFPNDELGAVVKLKPTATEEVLRIYKAQKQAEAQEESKQESVQETA